MIKNKGYILTVVIKHRTPQGKKNAEYKELFISPTLAAQIGVYGWEKSNRVRPAGPIKKAKRNQTPIHAGCWDRRIPATQALEELALLHGQIISEPKQPIARKSFDPYGAYYSPILRDCVGAMS